MVWTDPLKSPSAAWTADEDARLERVAKENGLGDWQRVAEQMPGRSHEICRGRWRNHLARHVYHRVFTARDDDELVRLYGSRWRDIGSSAIYGRSLGVLKKPRKVQICKNAAAKKYSSSCPTPAVPAPETSSPPLQHPQADALAQGLSSCNLDSDTTMDPRDGSLATSCID